MNFGVILEYVPVILKGTLATVLLMCVVGTLAPLLALPLALAREYGPHWARYPVNFFSWMMRAVPTLVLLYFAYFGLPALGVYLPATVSALIALVISAMGYNIEFITAGLRSVHPQQFEACRALGMPRTTMIRRIVLPQAMAVTFPPLFSNLTLNLKGTSLASMVAVPELTGVISGLISETYRPIELLCCAGVIYLLLNSAILWLQAQMERRVDVKWLAEQSDLKPANLKTADAAAR